MMKSKLNRAVCNILLLIIFIEKMCIQVHATELDLEPNTYKDGNPFQFEISDTWTSEGQTIHSYDVSENGQIAIVFSNDTIGVFDHDMKFYTSYRLKPMVQRVYCGWMKIYYLLIFVQILPSEIILRKREINHPVFNKTSAQRVRGNRCCNEESLGVCL